jgi:plastocyanin
MDQSSAAYNGAAPDLGWLEHPPGSGSSPSIDSFTPDTGSSGTSVRIDGSYFTDATEVRFAGSRASFSVDSDTRITAVVPSAATTGQISVIGPGGTGTSATSFTVPIQGPRVNVADFSFKPKALLVDPGSVVQWFFRGPSSHTASDSNGLGPARAPLFDSGPKGTGEVYEFQFAAAGQYPYSSTAAEPRAMSGTIKVPVTIAPITGSTATRFTVTWASKSLSGFGFSVQSRFEPEGSSTFTKWTSFGPVQTAPSAVFVPDRGPGTYQFRSQLRNATTGAASLRSTPTSITVTS